MASGNMTLEITEDGRFVFHGKSYKPTEDKNALLAPLGKVLLNYGQELMMLPEGGEPQGINQQIGNARFVKNDYLNARIAYYGETKKTLSVGRYKKEYLPKLKEGNPFLLLSDKFALESAAEDVDAAYVNFFEGRAGFPKFASKNKPKGNKYRTKQTNNNIRVFYGRRNPEDLNEPEYPYIKLPKLEPIRFVLPLGKTIDDIVPKGARITSATVTLTGNSTYTVSLQMETVIDLAEPFEILSMKDVWAVDLGLKDFGTFGNLEETEVVENPRWIKLHAKRLRRLQKALSRKQYDEKAHRGSRNWEKARLKVAKEQRKAKNQRKDFHHKKSREIADRCKVFVCEDLCVKGMMKNRRMAKSVASVGWGQFLTFVEYKLKRKGGRLVKIDRWYPSSQLCFGCGYKNADVKDLKVRDWTCPSCGMHHDRDENAKNNICRKGIWDLMAEGIIVTGMETKMPSAA